MELVQQPQEEEEVVVPVSQRTLEDEGALFPPDCNWECYFERYPGLVANGIVARTQAGAVEHWQCCGRKHGRDCTCDEDFPQPTPTQPPTYAAATVTAAAAAAEVEDDTGAAATAAMAILQAPQGNGGNPSGLSSNIGFQSNWGDQSSYTGAMVYDFTRHAVYVTGTTYRPIQDSETTDSSDISPRSSCFVGQIPMANLNNIKLDDSPLPPSAKNPTKFVIPDSLADTEQMGCSSILYNSDATGEGFGRDYLYVGGVDEMAMNAREGRITAFVSVYGRSSNAPDWKNTGTNIPPAMAVMDAVPANTVDRVAAAVPRPIKYPIAMAYGWDGGTTESSDVAYEIAVLSVTSYDAFLTDTFIERGDKDVDHHKQLHKNSLLPPGIGAQSAPTQLDYYKRGSNFFPTLQRFAIKKGSTTVEWKATHDILPQTSTNTIDAEVFPTGLLNLGGMNKKIQYITVGSYRSSGGHPKHSGFTPTSSDQDYDGFVSNLAFPGNRPTWGPIIRMSSIETTPTHLHDYIHDVCPGLDADDSGSYYVVGSTYGTMPKGAVQTPDEESPDDNISGPDNKVSPVEYDPNTRLPNGRRRYDTLSGWVSKIQGKEVVWTTQLYGTNHAEVFGCHVIPQDPSKMYVGGTVYDNGEMMSVRSGTASQIRKSKSIRNSAGGDDVWVAQLQTNDGALVWIKQLGSSGNDRIARTKGVAADLDGDCIIYGETDGELYRSKKNDIDPTHTDIFVVKLDKFDGTYTSTVETDRMYNASVNTKHATLGTVGGILLVLSLCMCGCLFYRFQRPKRRRRTIEEFDKSDGVFTDDPKVNLSSFRDVIPSFDDVDDKVSATFRDVVSSFRGVDDKVSAKFRDVVSSFRDVDGDVVDQGLANVENTDESPAVVETTQQNGELPDQSSFKDNDDFIPGRNFV